MRLDRIGSRSASRSGSRYPIPQRQGAVSGWYPYRSGWLPSWPCFLAMREQRINNTELARRLGVHERVVRRMLDPGHATKAERIQAALAALGMQMTVEVRNAA